MKNSIKIFIVVGVFAALLVGGLKYFSVESNASLIDLAERFESSRFDKKLPASETKGTYSVDGAHSYVGFRVGHMGLVDVPGSFKSFDGSINLDSHKIENSTVEFTVDVGSVDTRITARDNHLKSKDFFLVEKYPQMSFKSTRVKKKGKKYRVYGNLTIKGVTREIMIPFRIYGPIKDPRGSIKMGIQGESTINRRDFNVDYGNSLPSGVAVISDNVKIDVQLETVLKKKETDSAKK